MRKLEATGSRSPVTSWLGQGELGHVVDDAVWTLLPDETRIERSQARRNNRRLAVGLTALTLSVAGLSGWLFSSDAAMFFLLAFPLPCISLFERFRRTTVADDAWLVEQPEENEFLVETLVEVNGVVMGSDRGVAWFETTAVCFTGQRSWFRIGLDRLSDQPEFDGAHERFSELNPGLTTMRIKYDEAHVRIKLIEGKPASSAEQARLAVQMAFLRRRRWEMSATTVFGQTTLPPLAADPEYRHDIFHNSEIWTTNYFAFLFLPLLALASSLYEALFGLFCILALALYMPVVRLVRPALIRARAFRVR